MTKREKQIEKLKKGVADESESLSWLTTFDYANWQNLIKNTIRDYLVITFNLEHTPRSETQKRLVNKLTSEQSAELYEMVDAINFKMKMGLVSCEKIVRYK